MLLEECARLAPSPHVSHDMQLVSSDLFDFS